MIKRKREFTGEEAAIALEDLTIASSAEGKRPSTVIDLILYLLGGFGLFLVASLALSLVSKVGTLSDSVARYLLNVLFLGGGALFWGLRRKKITWGQLGLSLKRWRWAFLGLAILITGALYPLRAGVAYALQMLLGGGMAGLQERSDILTAGGFSWPTFILTLIGVGILVPFSEELYFRGLLFNWFEEHMSFWPSVLISATLFGMGHFDSIGVAASAFLIGVVNAWVYARTRTLWLPVAIHVVTNSSAIILIFVAMLIQSKLTI